MKATRAAARKAARKVVKGATLAEAIGADVVLETTEEPCLIRTVTEVSNELGTRPGFYPGHFFAEMWSLEIDALLSEEAASRVFHEGLATIWGLLGLSASPPWITSGLMPWDIPPALRAGPYRARLNEARTRAYLERMVEEWPTIDGEGQRYSDGDSRMRVEVVDDGNPGFVIGYPDPTGLLNKTFWETRSIFKETLWELGVDIGDLNQTQDAATIVRLVKAALDPPLS